MSVSARDLIASTFFGGQGEDEAVAIALDSENNVYLSGWTYSPTLPSPPGASVVTSYGSRDIFLSKWNPNFASLIYCLRVGGSGEDIVYGMKIDQSGSLYLTGFTNSFDFPVTTKTQYRGGGDAFVLKLNSATGALEFSTLIGGGEVDYGYDILARSPTVYITGYTLSSDFPVVSAFDQSYNGGGDAFLAVFNPTDPVPIFSSFLGGSGLDSGQVLQLDRIGNIYIAGSTRSSDFPTKFPYDQSFNGNWDSFLAKLNPDGSALLYSTFLGGNQDDLAFALAVRDNEQAIIAGKTSSLNFPTTATAFDATPNGGKDGYLTELLTTAPSILYSTYIGGNQDDQVNSVALSDDGTLYLAGATYSPTFPVTTRAFQTDWHGQTDAFVVHLNSVGTSLLSSTFLGGKTSDAAKALYVQKEGVLLTGCTDSEDFPIRDSAFQITKAGGKDAFLSLLQLPTPSGLNLFPVTPTSTSGTTLNVEAQVLDQYEHPLEGIEVTFVVRGANQTTGASTSDANGIASWSYRGVNPGEDNLLITAEELSATCTHGWTAKLTLSPESSTTTIEEICHFQAKISNGDDWPLKGSEILFSISGAHARSITASSNESGIALLSYTETTPGIDYILATSCGATSNTVVNEWVPGFPSMLKIKCPEKARIGDKAIIRVQALDAYSNPVSFVPVAFQVEGINNFQGEATTDQLGWAQWSYTSTRTGTDTIVATYGLIRSEDVTCTWLERGHALPSIGRGSLLLLAFFLIISSFRAIWERGKSPSP